LRALYIAAAGAAGGEAVKRLARNLDNEIRDHEHRTEPEQEESEMPLNAEDFQRWLRES
jgi:hypothetical protein